jgi:hypothetical protein
MSINHQALRRLLEEAFDEYEYRRSLGLADPAARERAIEAALSAAQSIMATSEAVPERQLELPFAWRAGSAAAPQARSGLPIWRILAFARGKEGVV